MTTINTSFFSINGVIDPTQSVMSNINTLCTASGCWLSFDITEGLWSVTINRPGTPVITFDDSRIIGGINISGSGINEAYNKVSVEFPHAELLGQMDYVDMIVPESARLPNELDNTMNIRLDCVDDPIQAQYIGVMELKQSRLDKIIEFRTDYTVFGLRAGDLIGVDSAVYGFNNKVFRITSIREEDTDAGAIELSITALEYDPSVYSTDGLVREFRTKKTGIVPKSMNEELLKADKSAAAGALAGADDAALLMLLSKLMNGLGTVGVSVCVSSGSRRFTNLPLTIFTTTFNGSRNPQLLGVVSVFKPVVTGYYQATIVADQNTSDCGGRNADIASVSATIYENVPGGPVVYSEGSGGWGTWYWNDWVLGGVCRLEQGKQYALALYYEYGTEGGPGYSGPIDITYTWSINSLPGTIALG